MKWDITKKTFFLTLIVLVLLVTIVLGIWYLSIRKWVEVFMSTVIFGGLVSLSLHMVQNQRFKVEAYGYINFLAFHIYKTSKRGISIIAYTGDSVTYLGGSHCVDLGNEISKRISEVLKYESYSLGKKNKIHYRDFLKDIKDYYFSIDEFQTDVDKFNNELIKFVKNIRAEVRLSSNAPEPDVWYIVKRFYYQNKEKDIREEITEDGKRIEFINFLEKELADKKIDKKLNAFWQRFENLKLRNKRLFEIAEQLVKN